MSIRHLMHSLNRRYVVQTIILIVVLISGAAMAFGQTIPGIINNGGSNPTPGITTLSPSTWMVQVSNSGQWSGWREVGGGGVTSLPMAAVVFNNRLYLAGVGDDRKEYVNSTADGSTWSGWREVGGGGVTSLPMAAAVFNNRLYLAGVGDDRREYVNSTADGSSWSGWREVGGGGLTSLPMAAVVFNNRLYLAGVGDDRKEYVNSTADGLTWNEWREVGGDGLTSLALSGTAFNNQLYLTGVGDDHKEYINGTADGSIWSGWREVDGNGTTSRSLAATVFNNRLYLAGVGLDRKEYVNSSSSVGLDIAFALTVTGTNFVPGSSVQWNGSPRTTTYVSSTQLKAPIFTSDVATARNVLVTVVSPSPGGGASNAATFAVISGSPTLSSISPNTSVVGSTINVTLAGTNFVPGLSVAAGEGIVVSNVSVVNSTTATATLTVSESAVVGPRTVTVTTSAGTSNGLTFSVTSGTTSRPTLTSITPNSGEPGKTVNVTLTGTSFTSDLRVTTAASSSFITISNIAFVNSTTATATFTISVAAPAGTSIGISVTIGTTVTDSLPFTIVSTPVSSTPSQTTYLPQVAGGVASGVRWFTQIAVHNPATIGTGNTLVTIRFIKADGQNFNISGSYTDETGSAVGTGNTIIFQLSGGQSRLFVMANLDPNSPLTTGFALVQSSAPVIPTSVFESYLASSGVQTSSAGIAAASPLSRQALLAFADAKTHTAIALVNPNTAAVTVTFQLLDKNGQQLGTATRTLQANNQTALLVDELFPQISNASTLFFGVVRVTTSVGSPVVATTLLLDVVNGMVSGFPIIPLP